MGFLELLALRGRHHVEHHVARLLRRQRGFSDRHDAAIDFHRRRHARRDEQVGSLLVHHQLEKRGEIGAAHGGPRGSRRGATLQSYTSTVPN